MSFMPCNDVLQSVLDDCLNAPAAQAVRVPWAKGHGLNGDGRLHAIAAITSGSLGVAQTAKGKMAIYYSAKLAGKTLAKVLSSWEAGFYAALVAVFTVPAMQSSSILELWAALIVSLIGLVFFGPRALLSWNTHAMVSGASGRRFMASASVIYVGASALSIGTLWAVSVKLFGTAPIEGVSGYESLVAHTWDRWSFLAPIVLAITALVLSGVIFLPIAAFFWHCGLNRYGMEGTINTINQLSNHTPQMQLMYQRGTIGAVESKRGGGLVAVVYLAFLAGLVCIQFLMK